MQTFGIAMGFVQVLRRIVRGHTIASLLQACCLFYVGAIAKCLTSHLSSHLAVQNENFAERFAALGQLDLEHLSFSIDLH